MTVVDWLIVAFTALLALYGWAQGFVVGVLSLVGFAAGAVIGTRIGPLLLSGGDHSHYAPLFGLLGALLAGGVLASGLEGLGARVRRLMRFPGLQMLDGLAGAALTAAVALGIAWILGAVALQSSGSPALQRDIQRSVILRALNAVLPPSGPILNALGRFDPFPSIPGSVAGVPAPSRGIAAAPRVLAASRSVVRVLGTACGLGIEGSGWVAAPDLVVTNAHVVAGETDTVVEVSGAPPDLPVSVMAFDPHNDIAVLRVRGLHEPALPMAAVAAPGTSAAILGYPLDGPFVREPGRIGRAEKVHTENAYGVGNVLRTVVPVRGLIRPGNSGGPMVDAAGQVVATVFAAITSSTTVTGPGGFAIPDSLIAAAVRRAEARAAPVSTRQCAG
jgi:S1-C subfamily serine protease